MDVDAKKEPWYRDGLTFACTRCGHCCAGTPGYVWVELDEITRLADHLGISIDQFGRTYLRRVGDRLSLVETRDYSCVFWDKKTGCTVYEARPDQCRTWPFWPENLETPRDWARTQSFCPGSGTGRIHSLEEIRASAALCRDPSP